MPASTPPESFAFRVGRLLAQDEGELMRALADALGCPMPPLLPEQALA